jgi:hypothetical protein
VRLLAAYVSVAWQTLSRVLPRHATLKEGRGVAWQRRGTPRTPRCNGKCPASESVPPA